MKIGVIGLGRMGSNIARRLIRRGHDTVVYHRTAKPVTDLVKEGAIGASGLGDMRSKLDNPAIVWVMLPAGRPTEDTIDALGDIASVGDIIVDGGDRFSKEDRKSVVSGKSVSVGVDLGGRRIITKQQTNNRR